MHLTVEAINKKASVRSSEERSGKISPWNFIGPISLGVLAYSGQLGASPILGWLPVNVTALSIGLVILSFFASFLSTRRISPLLFVPLFIWLLLLIPATHYVPGAYSVEKITSIATILLLCLAAPFQLLRLRVQKVVFLWTLLISGFLSALLTLAGGATAAANAGLAENIIILDGANTIGTARIIGTSALILIAVSLSLQMRGVSIRRWGSLVCGLGLIATMVATGSRGPLAAIILGCLICILVVPSLSGRRLRLIFFLCFGAAVTFAWADTQERTYNDRAFAWLLGERDTSTEARQQLWEVAGNSTLQNPGGVGWGGFSGLSPGSNARSYPHNLVLELYVETGWLVATAVVIFICVSLVLLSRSSHDPVGTILFALAIFAFVNAMVSGDINDNRLLWILLGTGWASHKVSVDRHKLHIKTSYLSSPRY